MNGLPLMPPGQPTHSQPSRRFCSVIASFANHARHVESNTQLHILQHTVVISQPAGLPVPYWCNAHFLCRVAAPSHVICGCCLVISFTCCCILFVHNLFVRLQQVLLKQDSGEYACIAEDKVRYNLGDVKEELMAAMGLNTEEEGSTMAFLRRGYKTSTWFEDDAELEQHKDWRL